MKTERLLPLLVGILLLAQAVLALLSWFLSATSMEGSVRTLISAEGVRWFCATLTHVVGSPLLGCLVLLAMAWGTVSRSRLVAPQTHTARRRLALRMAVVVLLVCLALIAMLAFVPHAMLLSATGHLWPSPFSRALVPLFCLCTIAVAAIYGRASRAFLSFADVVRSWAAGVASASPLLVLYVFAVVFYASLRFVFQ